VVSRKELNLLSKIFKNLPVEFERNSYKVNIINKDELEKIICELNNLLMKKGLKGDYEPNLLGLDLEMLSDKFIHALQMFD